MDDLTVFEWYAPNTLSPLVFSEAPYVVRDWGGLGNTLGSPQMQKTPFQIGSTILNQRVDPRVFSITLRLVATSKVELDSLRAELSRSMVITPVRQTGELPQGVLRVLRPNKQPLELVCVPRESPQFTEINGAKWAVDADLEFVAPYPYWREIDNELAILEVPGGVSFPVSFPMEIQSFNLTVELDNQGDVATPIFARVYGELTTFRLINETTGEQIEITGSIADDDYVEVRTAFGEKSVVYVDTANGTRTDIFSRLTLGSTFWDLERGVNTITFEADNNVSGAANIYWREHYAGI